MIRRVRVRSYSGTLDTAEPETPRRIPGRKDTRHWCRGKVGVEHRPGWVNTHSRWSRADAYERGCVECGKRMRTKDWRDNSCHGRRWETVDGSCACAQTRGVHKYGCGAKSREVYHCICGHHPRPA